MFPVDDIGNSAEWPEYAVIKFLQKCRILLRPLTITNEQIYLLFIPRARNL
jgi:hypothetical protein